MTAITAPVRKLRFVPERALLHAEELAYLRGRLRRSIASPTLASLNVQDLHERIEAHVQGVLVAGQDMLELFQEWLQRDDRDEVFAAACGLLRARVPVFERAVIEAFMAAEGARLAGLADALGTGAGEGTVAALHQALAGTDAMRAAHAAVALANRRAMDAAHPRLAALLQAAEPAVAILAWRAVTLLDEPGTVHDRPYNAAVRSDNPAVRAAALTAAAWHGEAWVLPALAQLAQRGDVVGWRGLAGLGDARCVPLMQAGLDHAAPGELRVQLAARWGHPSAIEHVLAWMAEPDPLIASAAGEAFARLTGFDVEGRREAVPVSGDDVFAREFADEVWLPDLAKAQAFWQRHEATWRNGERWCRGFEVSTALASAAQPHINMQARWDFGARAALAGTRILQPPPVI